MALENGGLLKLVEECGELVQVAAKKAVRMEADEHWDGAGSLKQRLEEEMGDVLAAMQYVGARFGLDKGAVIARADKKLAGFRAWDAAAKSSVMSEEELGYPSFREQGSLPLG